MERKNYRRTGASGRCCARCTGSGLNGQTPDVEDAFADIVANTGKLPPHLKPTR
ncbi:MAG: hypothetical protein ACLRRK_00800 [Parasutterella sp.]